MFRGSQKALGENSAHFLCVGESFSHFCSQCLQNVDCGKHALSGCLSGTFKIHSPYSFVRAWFRPAASAPCRQSMHFGP